MAVLPHCGSPVAVLAIDGCCYGGGDGGGGRGRHASCAVSTADQSLLLFCFRLFRLFLLVRNAYNGRNGREGG